MNILLLGSGGREHAIAVSLAKSPLCEQLFIAPGNAGTSAVGKNVVLDIEDGAAVVKFAQENKCELVVIGPEAPLVAGVADEVRKANISCFGPGADGARLEGSKEFSKKFMIKHGLPTAEYASFNNRDEALAYLDEHPAPIVIKADGLAAGKGVTVAQTIEEAKTAVKECFDGRFGQAGSTVVIEECLTGPECSILAFVSNGKIICMPQAQDHKRALEGDKGPNTGGMGVYSPVPIVTDKESQEMQEVMERAARGLQEENIDYRGVLYGGFMLTKTGPKLLEFNARFGDPETQVILPRLMSDLAEIMLATANNELEKVSPKWSDNTAVCVVLASQGYPGSYKRGFEISGIEDAGSEQDVFVYHAGTSLDNGANSSLEHNNGEHHTSVNSNDAGANSAGSEVGCGDGKNAARRVVTNGGRVLNVTALAPSFEQAREKAYAACKKISWDGMTYRKDIGLRALKGRSAWE